MSCQCEVPEPHSNARYNCCAKCLKVLDSSCLADTYKLDRFFDRLPGIDQKLKEMCHAREQAGRVRFRYGYLGRDNVAECREEIADGLNYLFFEGLRDRWDDRDKDTRLLIAAHHLAQAFEALKGR